MRKARVWRAFFIQRRKFSETWNAWLGREDSNLRMVESKSGKPFNDFKGRSEKLHEYALRWVNSLDANSEWISGSALNSEVKVFCAPTALD
jgi:hypothetical protein